MLKWVISGWFVQFEKLNEQKAEHSKMNEYKKTISKLRTKIGSQQIRFRLEQYKGLQRF